MDVSGIVTRIDAECPTFAQVFEASQSGNPPMQESQAALYTLLSSIVGGRMYPVRSKEGGTYPQMIYVLEDSSPTSVGGYEVARTDYYALAVLAKTHDELLPLQDSIIAAFSGENISLTGAQFGYYDEEECYVLQFNISYSFLAASSQSMPAAFVYPIGRSAAPSTYDNFTKQRVDADYGITIVTETDNITTLQNELQAALLGWQQSSAHHEMEFSSGSSIESVGSLTMWREVYRDAYYISQS